MGVENYQLVVMSGPDCGLIYSLGVGRHSIGRGQSVGIRIDDPRIQSHHAMIDWSPPSLQAHSMTGDVQVTDLTIRLGDSLCVVQLVPPPKINSPEKSSPQPFHRPPQESLPKLLCPLLAEQFQSPHKPMTPPFTPLIAGVVTGLLLGIITGQMLFGLFAVMGIVVSAITWAVGHSSYRRALKRWNIDLYASHSKFEEECREYTDQLAQRQRALHPTIGELLGIVANGEATLWAGRDDWHIAIGRESQDIIAAPQARPSLVSDIPITVNIGPQQIIGLFGERADYVGMALIMRLAIHVGPADWQLIKVGDPGEKWSFLSELMHARQTSLERRDIGIPSVGVPHRVLLVTKPESVSSRTSLARRALHDECTALIVVAPHRAALPAICTQIIDADGANRDGISEKTAKNICHALQVWQDPDLISSDIPRYVDLLKTYSPSELNVDQIIDRWLSPDRRSLMANLGSSRDGNIEIDFDNDGPHAVIIGTTGSGKSELLRTLVISLALANSPEQVNFVLIDYKGGAAFDRCVSLPHVVGVITDLERGLAKRVLSSLEAELRHRESFLRSNGVSSLSEYRDQQGAGQALPRLMVIIDELAALREDVPDFIGSLISIAQRGRSLGIHLVVATQRPGMALSADVLANANIRLALRVQSASDSIEVIGSPIASSFVRDIPGRAVLRLGVDEQFVFQVASVPSGVEAILQAIFEATNILGIVAPRRPWLDPLPDKLAWPTQGDFVNPAELCVGMTDEPHQQRQSILLCDTTAHLLVSGDTRTGKTNVIQAVRMANNFLTARKAEVFIIYCASSMAIDEQCVDLSDRELVQRLLDYLLSVIRKNRSSETQTKRCLLFVDDVDIWRTHFIADRIGLSQWEMLEKIIVDGPVSGVTCVLTTSRPQVLPLLFLSRMRQHWQATKNPGSFLINQGGEDICAQVFLTSTVAEMASKSDVLRRLPSQLSVTSLRAQAWGILANDFREVDLPRSHPLNICVVGSGGSGRSNAVEMMSRAWQRCHCSGLVWDAKKLVADDFQLLEIDDLPTLIVVDDADRRTDLQHQMTRLLNTSRLKNYPFTCIISATANCFRTRPDHWANVVRSSRTGLLLGKSASEDGDLFGIFSTFPDVYPPAIGRGLWIEDGELIGVVQTAN